MIEVDVQIARLAARSHGLVTREQLLAAGLSRRQLERRLAAGLLRSLHAGVYVFGGGPVSFEQRVLAAVRAGRGIASHRCAAALFGLRRVPPGLVEITVVQRRAPSLRGVATHCAAQLAPQERATIVGIPVTAPARTLLDVAGRLPLDILAGALDDALVRHLTTLDALERLLERAGGKGRPGSGSLSRLVRERRLGRAPTESPLEDELFSLIRAAGLPEPVPQYPLALPGGPTVRFDGAYPGRRLAVEADGDRDHAGQADRRRDEERDRRCAALGWTVLRFGTSEIRERPGDVLAILAGLLRLAVPA